MKKALFAWLARSGWKIAGGLALLVVATLSMTITAATGNEGNVQVLATPPELGTIAKQNEVMWQHQVAKNEEIAISCTTQASGMIIAAQENGTLERVISPMEGINTALFTTSAPPNQNVLQAENGAPGMIVMANTAPPNVKLVEAENTLLKSVLVANTAPPNTASYTMTAACGDEFSLLI